MHLFRTPAIFLFRRFLIDNLRGIKASLKRFQIMSSGERYEVDRFEDLVRFGQLVLPHVGAAFNLARWLLHRSENAEDVAQEALLRA